MIEIRNLSFEFEKRKILKSINFNIEKGECILIAGKNGAGKTTLLRCLSGVYNKHGGEILLDGKSIGPKDRDKIGYLPSSLSLYDKMKIGEAIEFHKRVYSNFSLIDILTYKLEENRKIEELSKGEKVLFYLILTLSHDPSYFFIDDVLHFLDPYLREIFLNILIEKMEEKKLSIIMSSQTFSEIEGLPTQIIILDRGEIVLNENIETIKKTYVKITAKEIPDNLPVVYKTDWDSFEEAYVYPYSENFSGDFKVEFLRLSDIIKSIIGGNYAKKRD